MQSLLIAIVALSIFTQSISSSPGLVRVGSSSELTSSPQSRDSFSHGSAVLSVSGHQKRTPADSHFQRPAKNFVFRPSCDGQVPITIEEENNAKQMCLRSINGNRRDNSDKGMLQTYRGPDNFFTPENPDALRPSTLPFELYQVPINPNPSAQGKKATSSANTGRIFHEKFPANVDYAILRKSDCNVMGFVRKRESGGWTLCNNMVAVPED